MKIEDLSFCTEINDENTNNVSGGYIGDISGQLVDTFNSMYGFTADLYYSAGLSGLGDYWSGMSAVSVIPTDFGVI